jgi:prepilin-type processing-associated H-X9-DG protein/prepilin-type N-terminal cleavage/methylation domain-containing protein
MRAAWLPLHPCLPADCGDADEPASGVRKQRYNLIAVRDRARGWTLVELLVVIALITALAALLFPVLARARDQARRTICLSHLREIGQAHLLYLQDWDDRFPGWYETGPPRPEPFGPYRFWTEYLQPYLCSRAILHDPSAVGRGAPPARAWLADYVLLTWGPGEYGWPDVIYFRWPGPPFSLDQVRRPDETIALMDGWTTTRRVRSYSAAHGGGTNVSFVDGHARWLSGTEFWRVDTDGNGFYWLHYGTADQ